MMPLSGPERKKYLADMKAKKVGEGYCTSDPSGVLQRKIKWKDVAAKTDTGVRGSEMDIENVEVAGDGGLVEQSYLPKHKKTRTWKGDDLKQTLIKRDEENPGFSECSSGRFILASRFRFSQVR